MNNTIIAVAVIVVVVLGAFVAFQFGIFPTSVSGATGQAVFAVTDSAANLSSISSIQMTIQSVEVHSTDQGWVVVSNTPKIVDLLALNATSSNELLADVQLNATTYQQIRLNISQVIVVDSNGTHVAKLPSGELKIVANLVVNPNSTSTALFDFIAGDSLILTGNGQYIFAPVVHVQTTKNANVSIDSQNNVHITGGRTDTDEQVGMDINGNVGVNLGIPTNANVTIDVNGNIRIGLGSGQNPTTRTFSISETSYSITPNQITVNQGDTVQITITNNAGGYYPSQHNFYIQGYNGGTGTINPGQSATITFVASQKGTFTFTCTIDGHASLGMIGTLTVS